MVFLDNIKKEFYVANKAQDVDELAQILDKFDVECRSAIENTKSEHEKEQLIRDCITLHKELVSCLEDNKLTIKQEIHNAKSNSTKINKYLNV